MGFRSSLPGPFWPYRSGNGHQHLGYSQGNLLVRKQELSASARIPDAFRSTLLGSNVRDKKQPTHEEELSPFILLWQWLSVLRMQHLFDRALLVLSRISILRAYSCRRIPSSL